MTSQQAVKEADPPGFIVTEPANYVEANAAAQGQIMGSVQPQITTETQAIQNDLTQRQRELTGVEHSIFLLEPNNTAVMPVVIDSLDSDKYVVQTQTENTQNQGQIRSEPLPSGEVQMNQKLMNIMQDVPTKEPQITLGDIPTNKTEKGSEPAPLQTPGGGGLLEILSLTAMILPNKYGIPVKDMVDIGNFFRNYLVEQSVTGAFKVSFAENLYLSAFAARPELLVATLLSDLYVESFISNKVETIINDTRSGISDTKMKIANAGFFGTTLGRLKLSILYARLAQNISMDYVLRVPSNLEKLATKKIVNGFNDISTELSDVNNSYFENKLKSPMIQEQAVNTVSQNISRPIQRGDINMSQRPNPGRIAGTLFNPRQPKVQIPYPLLNVDQTQRLYQTR